MSTPTTKPCPDCAEQIKAEALVCWHCGYRFERKPSGVSKFALSNATIVVTLIGATTFFVAWLGQTVFYSRFGVEPGDVGLTYAETLTRAAAALFLVGGIALLLWFLGGRWVWRNAEPHLSFVRRAWFLALAFAAVFVGLIAVVSVTYWDKVDAVRSGNALTPKGVTPGIVRNPLGLRVERVRVSWIDKNKPGYAFHKRVVMYLGRASGVAVFYDPDFDRTVRVPDGGIVIQRDD